MVEKKLVAISLDPEEDEEPVYCTYNLDGEFHKVHEFTNNLKSISIDEAIKQFFQLDLPYITYHDANPFELLDEQCEVMHTRIFKSCDSVLERDTIIGNEIGCKFRKDRVEKIGDHCYLPGKPDLIYENYAFFKPDLQESIELNNDEFYKEYVSKFLNQISKKKLKKDYKLKNLENSTFSSMVKDLLSFQSPVEYQNYFTTHNGEFYDVFHDRIFQIIHQIYSEIIFNNDDKLRKFFNITDPSYNPKINDNDNVCLKPIGSVAQSTFPFGISDADTEFLNALLVHVELVNLSLGIGEGYELYFNSEKQNFQTIDGLKLLGPNSTKINNFLKYFTKCVSICLNSKTNRFIMMDYYWIGCFEIEDIQDGEIEDVKKLISKTKVRHFSYSNFENCENLSIRLIVASFFNITSSIYKKTLENIGIINKRIIKDWELFKKTDSHLHMISKSSNNIIDSRRKRFKLQPFIFKTSTGYQFQKKTVDLEKSLIKFIAIGKEWSCQTLVVNIKKLFQDKHHFIQLNHEGSKEVLLSVYDQQYDCTDFNFNEYYRDGRKLIMPKGSMDPLFGCSKERNGGMIVDESYLRWISNVDVYNKLKTLQGDVIAKIIDYGYLEDKPYNNGEELHFKTDGFYIIYEPISQDFQDMTPINIENEDHYELTKQTLLKIHELDVSINPHIKLSVDVLRYYKGKVYIINLEEANTLATKNSKAKDLVDLDRIFNKNTNSNIKSIASSGELTNSSRDKRRHKRSSSSSNFYKNLLQPYQQEYLDEEERAADMAELAVETELSDGDFGEVVDDEW